MRDTPYVWSLFAARRYLAAIVVLGLLSGGAVSQTQDAPDQPTHALSGELKRVRFPHTINKFDLQGVGVAQDLVVNAYAESGVISAPTLTMLLIHQDPESGHEYVVVEMPQTFNADTVFAMESEGVNCFLVDSSFFINTDETGRHFVMIRAVRDQSYGRSKISIDAYRLSGRTVAALHESLYRFEPIVSVSATADACSFRQLNRLEEKLLNVKFKE